MFSLINTSNQVEWIYIIVNHNINNYYHINILYFLEIEIIYKKQLVFLIKVVRSTEGKVFSFILKLYFLFTHTNHAHAPKKCVWYLSDPCLNQVSFKIGLYLGFSLILHFLKLCHDCRSFAKDQKKFLVNCDHRTEGGVGGLGPT